MQRNKDEEKHTVSIMEEKGASHATQKDVDCL